MGSKSLCFILYTYALKYMQQEYICALWDTTCCYYFRFIWPFCIFFQPQLLPGLQLASGTYNLTVPCPMPLSSHCSISVSLLWFFRLSCRIEQPAARRGGHFEYVKHLCTGPTHFPASLLLFLALLPGSASWIEYAHLSFCVMLRFLLNPD